MHDNNQEILPLVDEQGRVIGSATRGEMHDGTKRLHPVVHLHVFNTQGELYLQRRPAWKPIQPNKYDTAVGGHVDFGEEVHDALLRETREEIGLTDIHPEFITRYVFESAVERELVYVHRVITDSPIRPSDELDGGHFWSMDEIRHSLGQGILTPNLEQELQRLGWL